MKLIEDLGINWKREAIKVRPLQPFEDFYHPVRAYEAGFRKAYELIKERVQAEIGPAGLETIGFPLNLCDEEVNTAPSSEAPESAR